MGQLWQLGDVGGAKLDQALVWNVRTWPVGVKFPGPTRHPRHFERAPVHFRSTPNIGSIAALRRTDVQGQEERGAKAGMMSGRTPSQRPDVGQLDCQPLR
jgi:hypothetical protein